MSIAEKFEVIADAVYNKGKEKEWSDFWDSIAENGVGAYCFSGSVWNDTTFNPKFDIIPTSCASFFANNNITSLVKILNSNGVVLDTSQADSFGYSFYNCPKLTTLSTINYSKVTTTSKMNYTIMGCKELTTILGLVFPEEYTVHSATVYVLRNLPKLTNITSIEGKIKFNLDLSQSTLLTKTSINRIIGALFDYAANGGNTHGATIMFSDASTSLLTEDMRSNIASKGWEVM